MTRSKYIQRLNTSREGRKSLRRLIVGECTVQEGLNFIPKLDDKLEDRLPEFKITGLFQRRFSSITNDTLMALTLEDVTVNGIYEVDRGYIGLQPGVKLQFEATLVRESN